MHRRYVQSLLRSLPVLPSSAAGFDFPSLAHVLSAAAGAPLDHLYSRIGSINGPFFPGGWGNLGIVNYEEDLQHLLDVQPGAMKARRGPSRPFLEGGMGQRGRWIALRSSPEAVTAEDALSG